MNHRFFFSDVFCLQHMDLFFPDHRSDGSYPAQRKGPELTQPPALWDCPELIAAIVERRLRVFLDWHPGHSGVLLFGSEKRTSFSKSWSQLSQ